MRLWWLLKPSFNGGASRDRTDDLFHAMEALSQLSYGPVRKTLYLKGIIPPVQNRWRLPVVPRVARIPEIGRLESDSGTHYSTARSAAASFSATVRVLMRIRSASNGLVINRY